MAEVTGLDELRAMPAGPERVAAAQAWIDRQYELIEEARVLRNSAIRLLCLERMPDGKRRGPTETARLLGMAVSTVKSVRGTV